MAGSMVGTPIVRFFPVPDAWINFATNGVRQVALSAFDVARPLGIHLNTLIDDSLSRHTSLIHRLNKNSLLVSTAQNKSSSASWRGGLPSLINERHLLSSVSFGVRQRAS